MIRYWLIVVQHSYTEVQRNLLAVVRCYVAEQRYLPVVVHYVAVQNLCVAVQCYLPAVIQCYVAVQRSYVEVQC